VRHRKSGRPLGRNSAHRKALFRNMVTSFLENERIETTLAKAKEVRPIVERMITLGKRGDLHARRRVDAYLYNRAVVTHLFSDIAPRFSDQNGGYLRLTKTRVRKGDASQMAVIELTKAEAVVEAVTEETDKEADKKRKVEKKKVRKKD